MPSRARLEWNGDQIVEKLARASRAAIDETLDEADDDATASHTWKNRTTNLELNIVTVRAKIFIVRGYTRVRGSFGYTTMKRGKRTGWYGLFHEEGTVHEFAQPTIRPAGDRTFPTLASKIARNFHAR